MLPFVDHGTVKLNAPPAVGVPEIAPLLDSVRPVGSEPRADRKMYSRRCRRLRSRLAVGDALRAVRQPCGTDGEAARVPMLNV